MNFIEIDEPKKAKQLSLAHTDGNHQAAANKAVLILLAANLRGQLSGHQPAITMLTLALLIAGCQYIAKLDHLHILDLFISKIKHHIMT